jgi:hypothetical protein
MHVGFAFDERGGWDLVSVGGFGERAVGAELIEAAVDPFKGADAEITLLLQL